MEDCKQQSIHNKKRLCVTPRHQFKPKKQKITSNDSEDQTEITQFMDVAVSRTFPTNLVNTSPESFEKSQTSGQINVADAVAKFRSIRKGVVCGRVNIPRVSKSGVYLIEVGTIGEIKADPLALPKRRKDILKLDGMDDHIQYKFGFSKNLDDRMSQHMDNEFKNTLIVETWNWDVEGGMLVKGEEFVRSKFKELGCHILPNTCDWPVLSPRYKDVVSSVIRDGLKSYIVNNDPYVKIITGEAMNSARLSIIAAEHAAELLRLELEKKDMEIRAIRAETALRL